ncbi:MAG: hypothetical protein HBSAPP02_12730 [Phycisphaerae bacterium]|nr:MAG: hypothetical protein HBSAPP02_12730 [Phycisphaerae bacterium]
MRVSREHRNEIPSAPVDVGTRGLARRIGWGLVIATLLIYGACLRFDFVRLDDHQYVVENPRVREPSLDGLKAFFTEVLHPQTVDGYYQPLTMASLMLDSLIVGRSDAGPGLFHFTNVLIHAINAVLVFALLRTALTLHRTRSGAADGKEPLFAPAFAAALFALHPAQVEAVCWISQRKTVLATLFAILAIHAYLRHGARRGGGIAWAACGWYALATLAKPTTVLLPLVFPLLDRWPLRRRIAPHLTSKWPFGVWMVVTAWVAWESQASAPDALAVPSVQNWAVILRLAGLIAYNLMLYLGNLVWPMHLSPYRAIPEDLTFSNPAILAGVACAASIGLLVLAARRRWPPLFSGLVAFLLLLAPTLGGIRFTGTCVADRFLYLPLIFLLMPLTVLLWRGDLFMHRRNGAYRAAVALTLIPFIILTRAQQNVWADSKTLYSQITQSAPRQGKPFMHLATIAIDEDDAAEALRLSARAVELLPTDSEVWGVYGLALRMHGRPRDSVTAIRRALETGLGRNQSRGWIELAKSHTHLGELDAARAALREAVALGRNPAEVLAEVADEAMHRAKRADLALVLYREAIAADPTNATVTWNLGTALVATGQPAEALACYERAVSLRRQKRLSTAELDATVAQLREKVASMGSPTSAPVRAPEAGSP